MYHGAPCKANVSAHFPLLDGLLPAVVGLIAAAAWNLGVSSLSGLKYFLILAVGFALFKWTKVSPMLVILGTGVVGLVMQ